MNLSEMTYKQMLELRLKLNQEIESIERTAFVTLSKGEECSGFRLKPARRSRKIKDEAALVQFMQERGGCTNRDLYTAKLHGIPTLEKLAQTKGINIDTHIEVTLGEPKLEYVG